MRPNQLTPDQARDAIYLDFEGRRDDPPVLLGWAYAEEPAEPILTQVVIAPHFALMAEGKGLPVMELGELLRAIVGVAYASRPARKVVAWSSHEVNVVKGLERADAKIARRFEAVYVNAIPHCKDWVRRCHPDWVFPKTVWNGRYRLSAFLNHMEFSVSTVHGPDHTGSRIARIEEQLPKVGSYAAISPGRKKAWSFLLGHNAADVRGMRDVCIRAAAEMSGRAGS